MNSSVQTRSFDLWNQFHNTIANELNAEKNLKDKDSLFLFLDQRIAVIRGFIQQLQQQKLHDENLLTQQVAHLQELITKLQLLRESMSHPFVLYVMGMGKVGKSSLLNLLVGSKVADVDVLPKTWKTDFFYAAQSATQAVIKYRNGQEKILSINDAKKIIQDEELKREDSEDEVEKQFRQFSKALTAIEEKKKLREELEEKLLYRSDIKEIQWGLPDLPDHSILHQFSIVDTPGLWQSHNGKHGEHVGDFYHQADGILWLLDSTTLSANKPKQVLDQLAESLNHVGQKSENMLAVLSQIDKVRSSGGEQAVAGVVSSAKQIFDGYFLDVLPCSAKEALQGQKSHDQELINQSGYLELLNKIQKFFYDNAFSIRIEGKAKNFVGLIETHLQDSQSFLQRFDKDIETYDSYHQKILNDLKRLKEQYSKDWTSTFNSYSQKVQNNIYAYAQAYTELENDADKPSFVQKQIFIVDELQTMLSKFQRDKSTDLAKYGQQQYQHISQSFEKFSLISQLKPSTIMAHDHGGEIYKNQDIDFSGSDAEGIMIGGAAAGVAMLLLGPIGIAAAAIGFLWSKSRRVDKAKEAFNQQLETISNDCQANIKKFINILFEQHQKNLINHLNQEFSHLYLPRNECSEIFKVFHDLEKMKYEKFDRVHFQDFILGNP